MDSAASGSRITLLLVLAGALTLLLIIAAGVGGFLWGQASATPVAVVETGEPEVRVETIEVTRAVTVIVTATPGPTSRPVEQINPPQMPVPVETILPADTDAQEPQGEEERESFSDRIDFATFEEAWAIIEEEFDGDLPEPEELLYAAISGSVEALDDDYTRFLRPEIAERLREDLSGSVSGIGAFVRENEEGLVEIVRPIDGQPADLAGLLPGDVIVTVDGESALGLSFDEVLLLVRGPEGSTVDLEVARAGAEELLAFTITRAVFSIPIVESEMLGDDDTRIGYLRLASFTRDAEEAISTALDELLAGNPDGLILDLRDNGGGFLDQAVAVADLFLPESVVLFERSRNGLDETFTADSGDPGENLPLVVLVNAGSASASEIVAGAIQDNERGILVGETTFGKGSVQLVHTLRDSSELRVTIARWYTPGNRSISEAGIPPDIEVETPADLGDEEDPQLEAAVEYLSGSQ